MLPNVEVNLTNVAAADIAYSDISRWKKTVSSLWKLKFLLAQSIISLLKVALKIHNSYKKLSPLRFFTYQITVRNELSFVRLCVLPRCALWHLSNKVTPPKWHHYLWPNNKQPRSHFLQIKDTTTVTPNHMSFTVDRQYIYIFCACDFHRTAS